MDTIVTTVLDDYVHEPTDVKAFRSAVSRQKNPEKVALVGGAHVMSSDFSFASYIHTSKADFDGMTTHAIVRFPPDLFDKETKKLTQYPNCDLLTLVATEVNKAKMMSRNSNVMVLVVLPPFPPKDTASGKMLRALFQPEYTRRLHILRTLKASAIEEWVFKHPVRLGND